MNTTTLHTFKRGAWTAHVVRPAGRCTPMVQLDHPDGYLTSWPIFYPHNGTIGYVFDPPRDARRAVESAYRWIAENGA